MEIGSAAYDSKRSFFFMAATPFKMAINYLFQSFDIRSDTGGDLLTTPDRFIRPVSTVVITVTVEGSVDTAVITAGELVLVTWYWTWGQERQTYNHDIHYCNIKTRKPWKD